MKKKVLSVFLSMLLAFSITTSANAAEQSYKGVVIGDSVAAQYGVKESQGFVYLLSDMAIDAGLSHELVNMAVFGYDSTNVLKRLESLGNEVKGADVVLINVGASNIIVPCISVLASELMSANINDLADIDAITNINQIDSLVQEYIINRTFSDKEMAQISKGIDTFSQDLPAIIEKINKIAPDALIVVYTVYNPLPKELGIYKDIEKLLSDLNKIIKEDAKTYGYLVVDNYTLFKEAGLKSHGFDVSKNSFNPHPSAEGHKIIANATLEAYAKYLESFSKPTITPTITPTVTAPPSATPAATAKPSATPAATARPTATPAVTAPPSATPTATARPTATPAVTAPPSATPAATTRPTTTPAVTAPPSATPAVTAPPSATPAATTRPTTTPAVTAPPSATPAATTRPTTTPAVTAPPSATPTATARPTTTPAVTAPPSATPAATTRPTTTPAVTAPPSATPAVTAPPSATPAATTRPTTTPAVTAPPSATPAATTRPTTTPAVTAPPSATPTATARPTTTPAVTAPPSATPAVTAPPSATPATTTRPTATPAATTRPTATPVATKAPLRTPGPVTSTTEMTRGEVFAFAAKYLSNDFIGSVAKTYDIDLSNIEPFSDIPSNHPNYELITAAKYLGIVSGDGGNRFRPDDVMLRQDLIYIVNTILVEYLESNYEVVPFGVEAPEVKDRSSISSYARKSVENAVHSRVISLDNGNFNPKKGVTMDFINEIMTGIILK